MVKQVHDADVHIIISVWPRFDLGLANLAELEKAGAAFSAGLSERLSQGPGQMVRSVQSRRAAASTGSSFPKNFSRAALTAGGWTRAKPELGGKWGEMRDLTTGAGPGAKVFNAYPLMHSTGVYQGQRAETSDKRVFILTRSAYAGQQRNAAVTWSGDTQGDWEIFRKQIPAGLNFVATRHSVLEHRHRRLLRRRSGRSEIRRAVHALVPVRRVLPDVPRARHGQAQGDVAIRRGHAEDLDRLRPTALPSAAVHLFRFLEGDERRLHDDAPAGDGFPHGRERLQHPRSIPLRPGADGLPGHQGRRREAQRLSAGGRVVDRLLDGQDLSPADKRSTPLRRLKPCRCSCAPVRSFLTGPAIQYAAQKRPIRSNCASIAARTAAFTLYEDEGDNYNYEKGAYATIPIQWNEAKQTLTIGERRGEFPGMLKQRTFRIVWVSPGNGAGIPSAATPDAEVSYNGTALDVRAKN